MQYLHYTLKGYNVQFKVVKQKVPETMVTIICLRLVLTNSVLYIESILGFLSDSCPISRSCRVLPFFAGLIKGTQD